MSEDSGTGQLVSGTGQVVSVIDHTVSAVLVVNRHLTFMYIFDKFGNSCTTSDSWGCEFRKFLEIPGNLFQFPPNFPKF